MNFAFALLLGSGVSGLSYVWMDAFLQLVSSLRAGVLARVGHLMRKRRLGLFKIQFPDALNLMANALRSGLSLQQSFEMAAQELEAPLSQEFSQVIAHVQLGKSFNESLAHLQLRVPLLEVELLVSSLQILRETGGNLIETMEIIIHTIREEQRVRSKIKTLTTQGVAQAVVICALPFFLAAALYIVSPEYMTPLWSHWFGWVLIAAMLLMQGLGVWIMLRILRIDV